MYFIKLTVDRKVLQIRVFIMHYSECVKEDVAGWEVV